MQLISHVPSLNRISIAVWLFAVSLACSWLWPVQGLLWERFDQEVIAVSGLLIMSALICVRSLSLSWPLVVVLAASVIPLIQVAAGIIFFRGDGVLAFFYVIIFLFSVVLGAGVAKTYGNKTAVQPLCFAVLIAAVLSSFIAVRQWLGLANSIWEISYHGARPYGNLSQPNHLATLLCMGLFSLTYFYERQLLGRILSAFLAIVLLVGLALTQSRTAWVILGFAVLLRIAFNARLNCRLTGKVIALWVMGFCVLSVLLPFIADTLDAQALGVGRRTVSSARLTIWQSVFQMILNGPSFGFGWNQVVVAQSQYLDTYPVKGGILYYSHNLFLDLMLWSGPWVGVILTVWLLVWQKRLLSTVRTTESFTAALLVGGVFVHSMFEYPYAYTYFLIPAGFMLGVLESACPAVRIISWGLWKSLLVAILGSGALLVLVQEYSYFEKNDFNRRVSRAGVAGFEQVDPGRNVVLLTQLEGLQQFRNQNNLYGLDENSLDRMGVVVARYPMLANIYRYALALAANGRFEASAVNLRHMTLIHGSEYLEMALDQIEAEVGIEARNRLEGLLAL